MKKDKITKRIRIVFYLSTPGGLTGAPRRLLTLITALQNSDKFDVALLGDSRDRLSQEAENRGIKVLPIHRGAILSRREKALLTGSIWFKIKTGWELLKYNIKILRILRRFKPDAIWIRGSKGIAFGGFATLALRRPLVWDIDYELPSRGLIALLHRLGLKLSDKVVLQYNAADKAIFGKKMAKRFRDKFIALVPGIELDQLASCQKLRKQVIQSKKNNNSSTFSMLQGGSIVDRKNQRFTLKVLYKLKRSYPKFNFELWLVGKERDMTYAKLLRQDLNKFDLWENVKFLGWCDDMGKILACADLLLLPSKDEGTPNIIQEAMYIGCPVLASDVGGIPEIIKNGKTGWILSLEDPSVWAEKIAWIAFNYKKTFKISEKASQYAEQDFSVNKWGSQYADIFYSATNYHMSS